MAKPAQVTVEKLKKNFDNVILNSATNSHDTWCVAVWPLHNDNKHSQRLRV